VKEQLNLVNNVPDPGLLSHSISSPFIVDISILLIHCAKFSLTHNCLFCIFNSPQSEVFSKTHNIIAQQYKIVPVSIGDLETYESIQRGIVDGGVFSCPSVKAYRLDELVKARDRLSGRAQLRKTISA